VNTPVKSSLLSKSDFRAAQSCPTKLFYRKHRYASAKDASNGQKLLGNAGVIVQAIARVLYAEGEEIEAELGTEESAQRAVRMLARDEVTLFGAPLISAGKEARFDILRKRGNEIEVVDIKAKAFDSRENNIALTRSGRSLFWLRRGESIAVEWRPDIEDVAFQMLILQELFPDAQVRPFFLMPDKAKVSSLANIYSQFEIQCETRDDSGRQKMFATFRGDPVTLQKDHFLSLVPIEKEVRVLINSVRQAAAPYVESLQLPLRKISVPLSVECRDCEFRVPVASQPNGFHECWQGLAQVNPNILDLYHVSDIGGQDRSLPHRLISRGAVSLSDIPEKCLSRKDGSVGEISKRQRIQIANAPRGTEWISTELYEILARLEFPLRFVDFETATPAVPYHAGMHPFETIAFQWSCHTVQTAYSLPEHSEWLHSSDGFPNFEFAESLMRQLGTAGTILTWSAHEQTILKAILCQMTERNYKNDQLQTWLLRVLQTNDDSSNWFVDLNKLCLKHYFHPLMKGSTSIKKVCDAIWQTNPDLNKEFPEYYIETEDGSLSPYDALPRVEIDSSQAAVREGTAAVLAYESMMAKKPDSDVQRRWRQLLLQYCKLDTLAMVWIWRHWQGRRSPRQKIDPGALEKTCSATRPH
jgi:hypothetical protein